MFMARAYSRLEYFVEYTAEDLKQLFNKVREFMNKIKREIEEGK